MRLTPTHGQEVILMKGSATALRLDPQLLE
jgi:hypothetical protein